MSNWFENHQLRFICSACGEETFKHHEPLGLCDRCSQPLEASEETGVSWLAYRELVQTGWLKETETAVLVATGIQRNTGNSTH